MTNIFIELVAHFGGQVATAKALGVTQGTVSGWTRGIHGCSADVALLAQTKTSGTFLASQLRPSLTESLPTMEVNLRVPPQPNQSHEHAGFSSSTQRAG